MSKLDQRTFKLYSAKAVSIDDDTKSIRWVLSTDQEDRYGEKVDQESWDFKSFKNNPVLLWGHDPREPENVLGTVSDWKVEDDPARSGGKRLTALLTFDTEVNPKAELIYGQIKKGSLRTGSVGFIPHTFEYVEDVPVLKDNELLEFSICAIPANAGAVALSLKDGSLNVKDARWMLDSMRREAEAIEKQLKENKEIKKSMTEEQATQLIEGQAALQESVKALTDGLQAVQTDIEALKAAPPAKGGDNDQPGAGEEADNVDEDTELTPEQIEELEAAAEAEAQAQVEAGTDD